MAKSKDPGSRAEEVVVSIVSGWIARQKLFKCRRRIIQVIRAKKNDRLDEEAMDVSIFFDSGLMLPLQVKFASRYLEDQLAKHRRIHSHILYVLVIKHLPRRWNYQDKRYRGIAKELEAIINKAIKNNNGCASHVPS